MKSYQIHKIEVYNRWTVETSIDVMWGIMCLDWNPFILDMFVIDGHLN